MVKKHVNKIYYLLEKILYVSGKIQKTLLDEENIANKSIEATKAKRPISNPQRKKHKAFLKCLEDIKNGCQIPVVLKDNVQLHSVSTFPLLQLRMFHYQYYITTNKL